MDIELALRNIQQFEEGSLTTKLASLELAFQGKSREQTIGLGIVNHLGTSLIESAILLKNLAGQIHVVIHAAGILLSLPSILHEGEVVKYLSLGAGNTGRMFDLETNQRVAEYKFIDWKGGPESIRQNSLFKDFYNLAEFETSQERYLYVLGLAFPLKFFNGHRSVDSVLSRNNKLSKLFRQKYGDRFETVRNYYDYRKAQVNIVDLLPLMPSLSYLQ